MTYDYFYGQQAEMFTFYRVPKVLFTEDCFWNVSTDAKLLYSKKFFEEHRDELMLHKAAKQAFDQLDGQKVPSRQALHEEFNRLLVEKKQAYAEYRQVKKEMQEYLIAKQTVEHILGIDRHKRVEEKKQQKEEQR